MRSRRSRPSSVTSRLIHGPRITASPAIVTATAKPDLPGRAERVVRRQERADAGEHENRADHQTECRLPSTEHRLQRTPRGLRQPGALVVVGTRPQHGHAESAERDGPHGDVAEPRPDVAEQQHRARDDEPDGDRATDVAVVKVEVCEPVRPAFRDGLSLSGPGMSHQSTK